MPRQFNGITGDARKRITVTPRYYLDMIGNNITLLEAKRSNLLMQHREIMERIYQISTRIQDLKAEQNETERGTMP